MASAAQAYHMDCPPGSINAFRNEINAEIAKLISGLKSTRNDRTIEHIFGTDIEQTIMRHSNNPDDRWIQSLLGKKYGFSPSEWDIIFKGRHAHTKGKNMTNISTDNEYAFNRAKSNYNLLKQRTTRKHKGGNTKYSRKRRQ